MHPRRTFPNPAGMQGAVLVVSLLFLLVLTLIGVAGLQNTTIQEKMAGNLRDQNTAFQSAEAAIREGESYLEDIVSPAALNGSNGLFGEADTEPGYNTAGTWTNNALSRAAEAVPGTYANPRYFIKYNNVIPGVKGAKNIGVGNGKNVGSGDVTTFRITARATGAGEQGAEVLLRTYYGRMF